MEVERKKMVYEIRKNINYIRIFGEEFIKNNKNKGKIIYNNKKYPFKDLFQVKKRMNNKLKIQVLLGKNCCNKSCMFKNCSSLIIFECNNKKYNIEDPVLEEINNFYSNLLLILANKNFKHNNNKNECNVVSDLFPFNTYLFDSIPNNNFQNNKIMDNDFNLNIKISAMNEIFSNCTSLISFPDISNWDTNDVIDMNKIFYNCRSLSSLPDISKWNTKNVIDMSNIFYNCSSLSLLPDISNGVLRMLKILVKCFIIVHL